MIKVLLFDMDGTIADTEPLHFKALQGLMAERGRTLSPEAFHQDLSGKTSAEVTALLFPEDSADSLEVLTRRKEEIFRTLIDHLTPTEGLTALLQLVERLGFKVALVTNAPRANMAQVLAALGLSDRFQVIVLAEDVGRAKPDPLPYSEALRLLGADPRQALAFEDSVPGVRSASAAGIRTIGLATSLDPSALIAAGAAFVVDNFLDPLILSELPEAVGI